MSAFLLKCLNDDAVMALTHVETKGLYPMIFSCPKCTCKVEYTQAQPPVRVD